VRDWTRFLRHWIRKYPDSPTTRYRFLCRFIFSTLESGFIISGFAVEFAGCVWTVSGKKKLRIRKYPDTCGRDLKGACCLQWRWVLNICNSPFIIFLQIIFVKILQRTFIHFTDVPPVYRVLKWKPKFATEA